VSGKPASQADGAWPPRSIWLPCAPTFACSGALVMAAGAAAVMGSWDTPAPGLNWLGAGAAGQGVLAAVAVGILMAGVKRPGLAHLKSPARARPGLVTRSLKAPQITRFGTAPDSRLGDQVAEHNDGDARDGRIDCRSRSVRRSADLCLSLPLRLSWARWFPGSRCGGAVAPVPARRLAARTVESTARLRPPGRESD
jgi:hypothetical protein